MTKNKRKTLVITAAVGFDYAKIQPFLQSLNNAGYQGDVLLIVGKKLDAELRAMDLLDSGRIRTIVRTNWLPYTLKMHRGRRQRLMPLWYPFRFVLWLMLRLVRIAVPAQTGRTMQYALAQLLLSPSETRFIHALEFLKKNHYSHVLLTDSRDVYFQSNFAEMLPESGISVGIESFACLRAQEHNARWVRLSYGEAMLDLIGDHPVSCSGVVWGEYSAILRYLAAMTEEVLGMSYPATARPIDQAFHNMLLWTGRLEGPVHQLLSCKSALATLSIKSDVDSLQIGDDHVAKNPDGSEIAILHMYDRWPSLQSKLLARLG